MGKAADLVKRIDIPMMEVDVTVQGGIEKIPLYLLDLIDWADIKKAVSIDMWKTLLDMYAKLESMGPEEKSQAGVEVLQQMGYDLQIAMYSRAFKKWDKEVTDIQVAHIVSYGFADQGALIRGLFFMLQGTTVEDLEAVEDKNPEGEADALLAPVTTESQGAQAATPSEEELLIGAQSESTSPGGTGSLPGTGDS